MERKLKTLLAILDTTGTFLSPGEQFQKGDVVALLDPARRNFLFRKEFFVDHDLNGWVERLRPGVKKRFFNPRPIPFDQVLNEFRHSFSPKGVRVRPSREDVVDDRESDELNLYVHNNRKSQGASREA